jgi:hypothetical protein
MLSFERLLALALAAALPAAAWAAPKEKKSDKKQAEEQSAEQEKPREKKKLKEVSFDKGGASTGASFQTLGDSKPQPKAKDAGPAKTQSAPGGAITGGSGEGAGGKTGQAPRVKLGPGVSPGFHPKMPNAGRNASRGAKTDSQMQGDSAPAAPVADLASEQKEHNVSRNLAGTPEVGAAKEVKPGQQ